MTGGGGYVASHCIVDLLKDDFDVIAVDNFINSVPGELKNSKILQQSVHISYLFESACKYYHPVRN